MAVIVCSTPTKPPPAGAPVKGLLPLIAPSLVLVLFFAIPMGMMIGISFQSQAEGSPTLASYSRFFSNDLVLAGLARTVVMSGLVALCVTVLAYPLAYYLARATSRWRTVIFALAIAPELAGVVLRTYGWLIILEDRGFINSALMWTGLITEPLPLSKNLFGVVVGLTHVILPFGVLSLLTSLQGINPSLEKSAQILGASRLAVIRHIILPLSVPGIVSSFLIGFTMAASAYATPALLGGAGFKVMATMVYEQVLFYLDWPFAAVMANVLLILMLAAGFVGSRLESRLHQKLHL
ncbi:ABC transporter permease [Ensifer adhaerens]|jgi:putative spermidine/putrescine transport system permease protein|nr:ABC transporter permease [Ensifer adhaerens]KDP72367.1 ABC transporter permease [Ensifer adhaerens]RAS07224.1 putative spermidine/putrescine transport system permease protein [Ensifer adhaerens]SFH03616.1 putative spermidine/putrescine transport system permease protein [Ensifer sp. OV372]